MSTLTTALKAQHAAIANVFERMTRDGVISPEQRHLLFEAKELLVGHLAAEDRELYPALRRAAERDAALGLTIEMFARDLDRVTQEALDFFARYEQSSASPAFARDLGRLVVLISHRISREEDLLYPAYEKLSARA